MSRRGRSAPTISLFAFQDIITSVTAIVIVIALFLALDLVQRKQSAHAESSAGVAEDLAARISEIEAEVAQLRVETTRTDATVKEVAKFSPAELQAEVSQLQRAIQNLESERGKLDERQKTWKSREQAVLVQKFDLQPKQAQLEVIEGETQSLQQQIEDTRRDNRQVFALPRGFDKAGWIAVIESNAISLAPLGRAAKPIHFRQAGLKLLNGTPVDALMKWIQTGGHQSAYFLLLVRPGGATQFDDLDIRLTDESISHGFDVIDAKQQILHPVRGAVH